MSNWHDSSVNEPKAISRKWILSLIAILPNPSAMFEGIEIAALRIWLHNADCS